MRKVAPSEKRLTIRSGTRRPARSHGAYRPAGTGSVLESAANIARHSSAPTASLPPGAGHRFPPS